MNNLGLTIYNKDGRNSLNKDELNIYSRKIIGKTSDGIEQDEFEEYIDYSAIEKINTDSLKDKNSK